MRHSLVSYNTVSAKAIGLDAEATAGGIEVGAGSTAILAYSVSGTTPRLPPKGLLAPWPAVLIWPAPRPCTAWLFSAMPQTRAEPRSSRTERGCGGRRLSYQRKR